MKKRKTYKIDRPGYVGFTVTDDERAIIERGAARLGKSISDYLRDLARQDDRKYQLEVSKMKNQVAEYA